MPPQLQRRHGLHASIRPGREMDRREREWLLREGGHGAHLDLQLWAGRGTERRQRESLLMMGGHGAHLDLQLWVGRGTGQRQRESLLMTGGHGAHLGLQLWAGLGTERRLRESLLLWAGRVNHDLQQRMGYCPGRAGFSSSRRGCSLGQHLLLVDRKAPLVIAPL